MSTSSLPGGTHVLSGVESQHLRSFCTSESFSQSDLDTYAYLLQSGPLDDIRNDFSQRAQNGNSQEISGLDVARQSLAAIAYGPTKVPLFNYLLQLTILNPSSRTLYLDITRFLALEAKVPCDSLDLRSTSAFMYAISTKPYWDPEFAEIMLEADATVNRRIDYSSDGKKKTIDALKWFLQKGGDLDIKDGDGVTPRRIGTAVVRLVPGMSRLLNGNSNSGASSASSGPKL
ncbi:hypothetical protein BJ875DRAFT_546709 [Amylocarpus encephaloides]|uniref:Uncharacterized protein n=1 Tax=Amylocarpus encephaloides TaxID=45428 RepID=A0A9P7YAR5_9HELO|nr:hypothetical protein BJ875DRAFT_546709 [Amylocarpus encephaloides]